MVFEKMTSIYCDGQYTDTRSNIQIKFNKRIENQVIKKVYNITYFYTFAKNNKLCTGH